MKKLIFLLFIPLVFACGNDSKKELSVLEQAAADGKKMAEDWCDAYSIEIRGKVPKVKEEFSKINQEMYYEMKEKYGELEKLDPNSKVVKAFWDAFKNYLYKDCRYNLRNKSFKNLLN
tara:strand:+ start:322 stop:675 length:354 start_codon:yes stop_codon:yes gene_type:complete